jgi:hypothetical protein
MLTLLKSSCACVVVTSIVFTIPPSPHPPSMTKVSLLSLLLKRDRFARNGDRTRSPAEGEGPLCVLPWTCVELPMPVSSGMPRSADCDSTSCQWPKGGPRRRLRMEIGGLGRIGEKVARQSAIMMRPDSIMLRMPNAMLLSKVDESVQ